MSALDANPYPVWHQLHVDQERRNAGPEALWDARPRLNHIQVYARARRVSPWAVLGVTLARISVATPPFVVLPALTGGQASINLFVGLVGPSGAGKGAAEAVAAEAVDIGGDPIEPIGAGSGEGIAHLFMARNGKEIEQHTTAVMLSIPEVDTLTALQGRQGSTLLPELRKVWNGERLGFAYVDPTKRLPLKPHAYRLGLVVGIQPARASALLDDVDGGTPQRFLWMPAIDPDAPDVPPDEPEPLPWKLPHWPYGNSQGRVVLRVCDTARQVIDAQRVARLRGTTAALDGHSLLARLKVGATLALLEGGTEVEDDDWNLAGLIMDKSDRTRAAVVEVLQRTATDANRRKGEAEATRQIVVEERVDEAKAKRVARNVIRNLNGTWTPEGEIRRGLASRDRGYLTEALERLLSAGQIELEDIDRDGGGHGGAGRHFRTAGGAR